MDCEPLIDANEAAKILDVHPVTVQRMAKQRRIPGLRLGRVWRFRASALDEWIREQTTAPAASRVVSETRKPGRRVRYQFGNVERKPRKHGPDVWVYRYTDDQKTRKSVILGTLDKYPTKPEALKAAESVRMWKANPDMRFTQAVTFGQVIDRYISESLPERYSTADSYQAWLRAYIKPKWGDYRIEDVRSGNVETWLHSLSLAPKSLNNIRCVMARVFKRAMSWNLIPLGVNPMSIVEIKGCTKRRKKAPALSVEQVRAFIGHIEREPFKTMAWLAVCLGLERSTVVGLRWRDIDFARHTVHVRTGMIDNHEGDTKNEYREAPLPLDPALADMLERWKQQTEFAGPDDWIFASPYFAGEFPYNPRHVARLHFWPAAKLAGLGERLGWQSLRRTYSSLLTALGTHVKVTQSLMRHSDPQTTLGLYTDTYDEEMRKANSRVVGRIIQSEAGG
jgi:excisionase family DNA binding protein